MTEGRAFLLVLIGTGILTVASTVGLIALGVEGQGVSLGGIGSAMLGGYLSAGVVMRYGKSGRPPER